MPDEEALNRIFAAVAVGAAVGAAWFGLKGAIFGALLGLFYVAYENARK